MKQSKYICIMLLVIISVGSTSVMPTIGADIVVKNKYVWRGIVFNDEYAFWPDVWVNWRSFTLTVWGSLDLTDYKNEQYKITDIAGFFDYSHSFGPLSMTLGYVHYMYPGYAGAYPATGELYGKINTDLEIVQTSIEANFDFIEVNGYYVSPKLNKSHTFGPVTTDLTLSIGYADKKHNSYYFDLEKSGLTDFTGSLTISFAPSAPVGNFLCISCDLNYAQIIDGDLANQFPENNKSFSFGLGFNLFYSIGGN